MKLLVISPFLCGPQSGNGGGVLTYRQIAALSGTNELSFVSFSGILPKAVETECTESLLQICSKVNTTPITIDRWKVAKAVFKTLALKRPHLASICWLPEMQALLVQQLEEFKPDVVWIQFPQMAQYVSLCGSVPCIMDVQDAYTLSGFRQAQRMTGFQQVLSFLDWVCWARYEAHYYPKFRTVLTLSEQDAKLLQSMNPLMRPVSIGLPLADSRTERANPEPMRVGFAGAFDHKPNVEALQWFLNQVWPRVRQRSADARLVIAGRNVPEVLLKQSDLNVQFVGFVPDIQAFYANNTVTIAPMVSGGGVKVKSVEAMLAGTALVSTTIGLEGIDARDGKDVLIADSPGEFASAIVNLLHNSQLREGLAASAMKRAIHQFSSSEWVLRIKEILSKTTTLYV